MFKPVQPAPDPARDAVDAADVLAWLDDLNRLGADADDVELVDRLDALERVKRSIAAAQATVTLQFHASQCAQHRAAGMRADKVGAGVGAQVALARREPPALTRPAFFGQYLDYC